MEKDYYPILKQKDIYFSQQGSNLDVKSIQKINPKWRFCSAWVIMPDFQTQHSQICECLGILGNISRSDPDTRLVMAKHN